MSSSSSQHSMTLAQYLVAALETYDVDTVFGIPGVHTVELYRALNGSALRHVTPRNEQGAGFLADGYARASGKVAACFVITGPGMTNIATPMGQALADSVPMLVISSVNPVGRMGSGDGWLHEMPDQRGLAGQLTAFSHTVLDPAELPKVLARAFSVFRSRRPAPVHIEIPVDLFARTMSDAALPVTAPQIPAAPVATPADLAALVKASDAAERPVILAGGGAANAAEDLRRLAERLDAPVVMTMNGRGILPDDHPLAVPCGPALDPVREMVETADLVLALGTEMGPAEYDFYDRGLMALQGRLIRVDIDAQQMMRGPQADPAILADCAATLRNLPELTLKDCDGAGRAARCRDAVRDGTSPLHASCQAMLSQLREALPDAVIVGDSAQPVYAGMLHFGVNQPRSWFCSATGFGTLGYAVSAATGAWLSTGRPVIAVIGDGGIQFNLGEIATAREIGCPLIILLWNNNGYLEIKRFMEGRDIPTIGVDIFTPDFQTLAKGFDCEAVMLDRPGDLSAAAQAAAERDRPTLIELNETRYCDARA
ncbi:5-guanidino-2-oxopentanoate decarboxylase [Roseovarius sp. PS-C2]|uniref:5-guanidino-2-oxopentanoate decarboxylase n=1 Tax=Roseovarius sp. PS-C2 TaxID=2820814 RepID=UPI001C0DE5EA|nr:5-guanidino-2-oxopentanoate decarboxylase [Roseovarius sp. PS-C2]MBU3261911.1 5-guanidino-2-oxopentanoate decarboxylase [Roseovarius sp. PS-C2]